MLSRVTFVLVVHAPSIQRPLVLVSDNDEQVVSRLVFTILVDEDSFNGEDRFASSDQLRRLFLTIAKVPQPDDFFTGAQQFIISIVDQHLLIGHSFELKQQLLQHQIVLVHSGIHGDQKELFGFLAGYLGKLDLTIWVLVGKFIVVNFDSLGADDAAEGTLFEQVVAVVLFFADGGFQQHFHHHHEFAVRFYLVVPFCCFFVFVHHQMNISLLTNIPSFLSLHWLNLKLVISLQIPVNFISKKLLILTSGSRCHPRLIINAVPGPHLVNERR